MEQSSYGFFGLNIHFLVFSVGFESYGIVKPHCTLVKFPHIKFQPVKASVLSLLFAEAYQLCCNTHSAEVFINSEFCNPVEFSLQTVRRFFLDYVFNSCKSAFNFPLKRKLNHPIPILVLIVFRKVGAKLEFGVFNAYFHTLSN